MALHSKPVFTDQRTRQKIDLHLRDINDKITETDIANVKTDVTSGSDEPEAKKEAEEILRKNQEEEKDRAKDDGNNSNSIQTPWNIME